MTFLPRVIVITLAAFGAAGLVGSMALLLYWRYFRGSTMTTTRAATLFWLRLVPVAASLVTSLLALGALARFEPREGIERTGIVLVVLALMAVATIARTIASAIGLRISSRRARSAWMASAEPVALAGIDVPAYAITSSFPIVAVVGTFRPRLIIARSVLEACSRNELTAIIAHERQHLHHKDNARRAILSSVPDVLAWLPFSTHVTKQWHVAAEEAADDAAARVGASAHVDLASALVRVARLAAGQPAANLPASALYRGENGENIERRVRRVLDGPVDRHADARVATLPIVAATVFLVSGVFALYAFHELIEAAVAYLP